MKNSWGKRICLMFALLLITCSKGGFTLANEEGDLAVLMDAQGPFAISEEPEMGTVCDLEEAEAGEELRPKEEDGVQDSPALVSGIEEPQMCNAELSESRQHIIDDEQMEDLFEELFEDTEDELFEVSEEFVEEEVSEADSDALEDEMVEMEQEALASQLRILPSFQISDQIYTGEPITPVPVLYDGGTQLVLDEDYENVTYENNTEIGAATVTVYGKGKYYGKSSATFQIIEKGCLPDELSRSSIGFYQWYAIRERGISSIITVPGLSKDEYEIIFPDDYSQVGTVTVTVVGKGYYEGQTKEYSLEVLPMSLETDGLEFVVRTDGRDGYFEYTGEEICPEGEFYQDEDGNGDLDWMVHYLQRDRDYTLTYENNIESGIATVVAQGIGNCTGTVYAEYRIARRHRVTLEVDPAIPLPVTLEDDPTKPLTQSEYYYRLSSELETINQNGIWVYEGQSLAEAYISKCRVYLQDFHLESRDERRVFLGWSTDPEGYEAMNLDGIFPMEDMTLYAKWSYEVNMILDPNGKILDVSHQDRSDVLIPEGSPIYPYLPTDDVYDTDQRDYRFLGWNTKPDGTGRWGEQLRVTEDKEGLVLYAIWEPKIRVLLKSGDGYFDAQSSSYDSESGIWKTSHNKYYEKEWYWPKGTRITKQHFYNVTYNCYSSREGWTLAGWSLTYGGEIVDLDDFVPEDDVTLYTVFRPTNTVTFQGDDLWEAGVWNNLTRQKEPFSLHVAEDVRLGTARSKEFSTQDLAAFLDDAQKNTANKYVDKELIGWKCISDQRVYSNEELMAFTVTQDETFVPVWGEGVPVTLHANGYGSFYRWEEGERVRLETVTVDSLKISSTIPQCNLSVDAQAQAAYRFAGYSDSPDGAQIRDLTENPITASGDLYAVWRRSCRVVWIGIRKLTKTEYLPEGTSVPRKNPTDFSYGYSYGSRVPFAGWSLTEGGPVLTTEEYADLIVKDGLVLFAVWDVEVEDEQTHNAGQGGDGQGNKENTNSPTNPSVPSVVVTSSTAPANERKVASSEYMAVQFIINTVTGEKKDRDFSGASYAPLRLSGKPLSKSAIRLSWKAVSGAVEYLVFGGKSGKNMKLLARGSMTSWTHRKLKKGTYYKYTVAARFGKSTVEEDMVLSTNVYVTTKGGKATNWNQLKSSDKTVKMKPGNRKKIRAKVSAGRRTVTKYRGLSFESTDPKIAYVDKKGNIKARRKGSCAIWVYTQSGLALKMKVKIR